MADDGVDAVPETSLPAVTGVNLLRTGAREASIRTFFWT
jgi:hypothetical protein